MPDPAERLNSIYIPGRHQKINSTMDMLPINIVIGDRTYRIKIKPHDEEVVRKVVKVINDKIVDFKTQFSGKDMQDYIAMVLVWYATLQANQPVPVNLFQTDEVVGKLQSIEDMLDRFLQ